MKKGTIKTSKSRITPHDHSIARPAPSTGAKQLYGTAEWINLVARLRRERGSNCAKCGRRGCRIIGDHIIELRDGGAPLDPANVQLICSPCHTLKTNAERSKRLHAPLA